MWDKPNIKMLLVEDNSHDAFFTIRALSKSRNPLVECQYVTNLRDAQYTLETEEGFDVVLLDLSLPDSNGTWVSRPEEFHL